MKINKPVSAFIIFIITLILSFLFVWPKYQESDALQNSLVQKQAEYNADAVYYSKITSLVKVMESKKEELAKIDSALPSNTSLAPLVYFFQKTGAENGLVVKVVNLAQVAPDTVNPNFKDIVFQISLLGTYQALRSFLTALDKSSRLFQVNSISFGASTAGQGVTVGKNQQTIYGFKLEVQTYTY